MRVYDSSYLVIIDCSLLMCSLIDDVMQAERCICSDLFFSLVLTHLMHLQACSSFRNRRTEVFDENLSITSNSPKGQT